MRTLVLLFSVAAIAHADQLVLKNGDRVSGAVIKKDDKSITIKSDSFGPITTAWDQIASITADQVVTVVLKGGKSVKGALTTAEGKVLVATTDARLPVDFADVQAIRNAEEQGTYERYQHPSLAELWTATGTLSFAGTAGNGRWSFSWVLWQRTAAPRRPMWLKRRTKQSEHSSAPERADLVDRCGTRLAAGLVVDRHAQRNS